MTPYGPQQPINEQALALPNPQAPASLSTFQLPQPQMPELQEPGPATPPATLGGLPGAAPAPTEGNRIALLRAEIERQVAANQEKADAQRRAFEESMKTSSLERYLPKPSARQMLSDALTNIGMAHLTKGSFTPIQQRRFDEALKAHGAEVESRKLALDAANSSANQLNQSLTQVRLAEALAEREANNQGKLAQAASETERKRKADDASARIRQGLLEVQQAASGPKEAQAAAKARLDDAMANMLEHGGRNIMEATSLYMANSGLKPGTPEYADESIKMLNRFKDATTRFNPNTNVTDTIKMDGDGNPVQIVGAKGGPKSVIPIGGDDGAVNWNKMTSTTKTMVESAPKVIGFVDRIESLLNDQEAKLGPASSRLREILAGKAGLNDPTYMALRTNVDLLVTNLMRMHVGSRGGVEIMKHFKDMIEVGKQDPANLRAVLGEVRAYAEDVAKKKPTGDAPSPGTPSPNPIRKEARAPVEEWVRVNGKLVKKGAR